MYPGAFYFREASAAYVFMIVVNMFFGVTATVTTFILQLFPDDLVWNLITSCSQKGKLFCHTSYPTNSLFSRENATLDYINS